MAILLTCEGKEKVVSPSNPGMFELSEVQEIVGGYIEIIFLQNEFVMVMDEEGKLKGKDVNFKATWIARKARAIFETDVIVGDVLICKNGEI